MANRTRCNFYFIHIFVYLIPVYYTLVCIRWCSHVVLLWIILTFPGRWFSYVGNAYGSTRPVGTAPWLGCIAYSCLLCRFSPLRPLPRVPSTQSRRPSAHNGPRPFRHLQLRYFTEKEIYGVWCMVGVQWTVWNGWFMSSCCNGLWSCLISRLSGIYSA